MSSRSTSVSPGREANGSYWVHRVVGLGGARDATEHQLEEQGVPLPFAQRAEWLRLTGYRDSKLLIVADASHRARAAAAIAVGRSRALPGHRLYKVERFGASPLPAADDELLNAITNAAHEDRLCIRVRIELFERDAELRQRLARTLKELGFVRSARTESYVRTPCLDLAPSEQELFARIAASARRNVRAPIKRGFTLAPLDDLQYVARLEQLMDEVYRRTGGRARSLPWAGILTGSRATPNRSRVVGLFAPNDKSPAGLVSFAWGCVNGNYVTYEAGASTRKHGFGNLAVAYTPLWDLIAWAKRSGATWFDFGGVSPHTAGAATDPLGGIAEFKRFFSERIVEVGEQWILEPRRIRAMIARALSAAVQHSRRSSSTPTRIVLPQT
jgi:hypothetical protein